MVFSQDDIKKLGIVDMSDEETKIMLDQLQSIILNKISVDTISRLGDDQVDELNSIDDMNDEQLQAWLEQRVPDFNQMLERVKNDTIDGVVKKRTEMLEYMDNSPITDV